MGRGRPGGNPELGKKYKFDYGNEEKHSEVLTIRVTPSMMSEIKQIGGESFRDFCRDAIAEALKKKQAQVEPEPTQQLEQRQLNSNAS